MIKKLVVIILFLYTLYVNTHNYSKKDIKKISDNRISILHDAIIQHDTAKAKKILENNIDINVYYTTKNKLFKKIAKKRYGKKCKQAFIPLLAIAAAQSNLEIVKLLVQKSRNKNPGVKLELYIKKPRFFKIKKKKLNTQIITLQTTPYIIALTKRKIDIADYLLEFQQKQDTPN